MLQIEILLDIVRTSGCHCKVLRSFPVERIEQGNELLPFMLCDLDFEPCHWSFALYFSSEIFNLYPFVLMLCHFAILCLNHMLIFASSRDKRTNNLPPKLGFSEELSLISEFVRKSRILLTEVSRSKVGLLTHMYRFYHALLVLITERLKQEQHVICQWRSGAYELLNEQTSLLNHQMENSLKPWFLRYQSSSQTNSEVLPFRIEGLPALIRSTCHCIKSLCASIGFAQVLLLSSSKDIDFSSVCTSAI
ncbi:hypothetical protein Tco_1516952 [Tanacetum coccineum]